MRKTTTLCLALTVLALAADAFAQQERKKRVAIFDFDYATVHGDVAAIFGTNIDVGKGVSDLLVTTLVKDGSYSVIERSALDKILAEQNFSNSDRANPTSAARLGKMLGVDAIVVGSITQFGTDTKNTNIGGVGGGWGGFGIGGVGRKSAKAIVGLTARIVDVDTGEILAVAEGKGESKRSSTSLLGGGAGWGGFGGGNVDFGHSNFQNTILGEAVKAAVDTLSTQVVAGKERLTLRTVAVEGLVAAVEGAEIVLNAGSSSGLKVGDQLTVERVTREIRDPASGKVIRRMTSPVGLVKVTDVDGVSAIASAVSGVGFKVGDSFKTVMK